MGKLYEDNNGLTAKQYKSIWDQLLCAIWNINLFAIFVPLGRND